MIEQLQAVRARYDEINCLLQDPTVIQDNARYAKLMKEYKILRRLRKRMMLTGLRAMQCSRRRRFWRKVAMKN